MDKNDPRYRLIAGAILEGIISIKEAEGDDKWIPDDIKKGALHRELGIPENEKIPTEKLEGLKARLHKKTESGEKLTAGELRLLRRVNFALNVR